MLAWKPGESQMDCGPNVYVGWRQNTRRRVVDVSAFFPLVFSVCITHLKPGTIVPPGIAPASRRIYIWMRLVNRLRRRLKGFLVCGMGLVVGFKSGTAGGIVWPKPR